MIDFHNHLLPGVDDGAETLEETRAGLEAFRAQGVSAVVVTPHFRASLLERPAQAAEALAKLDAAWEETRALAAAEFPGLRVERGVELMLDTLKSDLSDPRLRLAGTPFVLVEFPYMAVPPNAETVLFELGARGWVPVIAHPERYANAGPGTDAAAEWKRVGGLLQVNAGSLLGKYGEPPQRVAWELLRRGLADYVCSDFHRGTPRLAACRGALEEAGGAEQARLLLEENPARMLAGELPHPVPPLPARAPLWKRLFGRG